MTKYSFPRELAAGVERIWAHWVCGQNYDLPSLPPSSALLDILETAYLASLEREEARPVRLVLCAATGRRLRRHGLREPLNAFEFESPRELTPNELRRLAAATDPDQTAVWIGPTDKTAWGILGLVTYGTSWSAARRAERYSYWPPPSALLVEVRDPGYLKIYQGQYLILELRGGRLVEQEPLGLLDLIGTQEYLIGGLNKLRRRIQPPKSEPPREWGDFEWLAFLNVWFTIVGTVLRGEHGGLVAILNNAREARSAIRLKYATKAPGSRLLQEQFISFMNKRHLLGDILWAEEQRDPESSRPSRALFAANRESDSAHASLVDASTCVGGLGRVDGALVLTRSLELLGFGGEVLRSTRARQLPIFDVKSAARGERSRFDLEQFGMRHRAAILLCQRIQLATAFVASQDGGVSLVWNDGRSVNVKRNVRITSATIVGA